MPNMNFLMPLNSDIATKSFKYDIFSGKWTLLDSYRAGKWFKGYQTPVKNLREVYKILQENQKHPAFFIHGAYIKGINKEKMIRRKRTDHKDGLKPTITDTELNLFCLDVDGFSGHNIDAFIQEHLPFSFSSADYIYQYSASYALTSNTLKCHLFFWLKEPCYNTDIQEWIKKYNKEKDWGNILDPSVLTATQPVYTQKRICEGEEDPIPEDEFIGYISKQNSVLDWLPEPIAIIPKKKRTQTPKDKYNLKSGIKKILTAENFHDELNKLALSLINKKVPAQTVKLMLEGAMNSVPKKYKDDRWKERFDDIERSVDSAVDIVDKPTLEDILSWLASTDHIEVKANFAEKCLDLSPMDKTTAIQNISQVLNFGIADIKKTIKIAELQRDQEQKEAAKEAKSLERETNGIYEIKVTPINAWEVVKKSGNILAKTEKEPSIFTIGGTLARVDLGKPTTIRQISKSHEMGIDYPKIPIIIPYRKPYYSLGSRISKDIVYQNEKGTDIEPPQKLVHEIGQAENVNFKPLAGIVENPYVDPNWKVIQKEGYNKRTGLYTMLHHKLKIKKIEPEKAYEYLSKVVFDEFPFNEKIDEVVAVSALLTCVMRPTIAGDAGIPGYGIVSPIQSSGKTTLAQLISYSIYNRPVAASSWSADEEELGKHILAILQEGHSCVLFDNIKQGATIQSGRLANAMSNDVFGGRQLGENKTIEVPSSVIWLFTGNNIRFVGDFATRVYPININPNMANPNTRIFKREDIGQWAMENRKRIISAILSIILNGKEMEPIAGSTRFKLWDKFVRRPLYKITNIDLNDAVLKNQMDDPLRLIEINLLHQLYENFNDKNFTTKDIVNVAFNGFDNTSSDENELGAALIDLLDNKSRNKMTIGRYLSSIVDVVLGNYCLKKKISNVVNWKIQIVGVV